MRKTAATPEELLRWLLGSAALGATARFGLAAANQEFGKRDPLKPDTDLYDPSVDVPVRMSPKQYQKYMELRGAAGSPVKQAMWDNSVAAATMLGGGALGWHVVNKLIERRRKRQLAQELQQAKDELTGLTLGSAPAQPKVAAVWYMLDQAAEAHTKTAGASRAKDLGQKALDAIKHNPAVALGIGGTAGIVGLGSIPGVRDLVNPVGSGVARGAGSLAKGLLSPIGHGAASVLGPLATLSLLYGLSKGYDQLSAQNPRKLELAAMRKRIREEEARATPYFELKPELVEEAAPAKKSKSTPAESVGARYQDIDAARDAVKG